MKRGTYSNMESNRYRRAAKAGFSLVEALVVLVVLTIGILSIARIFPGGLLTVKRTGEQITGDRYGQKMLADIDQDPGLPESIVAYKQALNTNPDGTKDYIPDMGVDPDDLNNPTAIGVTDNTPTGVFDESFMHDVNRTNRVLGEPLRVPVSSPGTAAGNGPVFMLKYGPIYYNPDNLNSPNNLRVYGLTMQRSEQSSVAIPANPDPAAVLPNENVYALDMANPAAPKIAFYPRVGTDSRLFHITYRCYVQPATPGAPLTVEQHRGTFTVFDIPATAPFQPTWMPLFGPLMSPAPPATFVAMVRDSEDVSRQFKLVAAQPGIPVAGGLPFTTDPYEFAIYSVQAKYWAGTPVPVANLGVLIFNPHGYANYVQTSRGAQTPLARVDYTIYDNHIIRDDLSVPNSGPYTVRLSFQNILTAGTIHDTIDKNGIVTPLGYNGIFQQENATSDLIVLDTNTGEVIAEQNTSGIPQVTTNSVPVTLNAKAGVLTFNPVTDADKARIVGRNIRVLYRTELNWGTQIVKAHGHYTQANIPAEMDYNTYYVGGSSQSDGARNDRLYFAPSEAGKSVVCDFWVAYRDKATGLIVKTVEHNNEELLISSDKAKFETITGQPLALPYYELLPAPAGQTVEFTSAQTGYAVRDMHGSSIVARVAWRDSGRWRKRDSQSNMNNYSSR